VLARQQRGWRNNGHLHARHGRNKSRAHRHLGLAKAHIATNQPVHRQAAGQIINHLANRAQLVIGFLIRKARGKSIPATRWRLKNRRSAQRTLGRNTDQPVGHLADAFLQLGLLGLPRATAKLVQQPLFMAIAR